MEQSLEQDLLSSLPTCDQNRVSAVLARRVSVSLEQSHMQVSLAAAPFVTTMQCLSRASILPASPAQLQTDIFIL